VNVEVTPNLVSLAYDAALKSFWRKQALRKFLKQCGISESFLATWAADESKRVFLDRLFAKLQGIKKGATVIARMAKALAEQTHFPDLENWEDSEEKLKQARLSVEQLRAYLAQRQRETEEANDRAERLECARKRRAGIQRSQVDLQRLGDRLDELASRCGQQQAGYDFEHWFFDLLDFSEIVNRRPYWHGGRQMDGSLTLSDTTYLVDLKFTTGQAAPADVDTFRRKVQEKADNTMGIMVSMGGYSSVARGVASGARTPLLLLDHAHLYLVLRGTLSVAEVVERVRRHASQTAEAYLSADNFGSP
jgi:hypothetical protein